MPLAIVDGVWLLEGVRGCNAYLVETVEGGADRLVLIDAGFASSVDRIVEEVALVAPGRAPSAVLLTHGHPDHAGGAGALRARYGARVVMGAGDAGRGVPVERALEGECVVDGLRAVPVPGHTAGSYCYLRGSTEGGAPAVAFVGDLVISHDDGLARPLRAANEDDARYLASLSAFARCAPSIGLAGHGPPVVGDFSERLRLLAALPRRHPLAPRGLLQRARRLASFGREMWLPRSGGPSRRG